MARYSLKYRGCAVISPLLIVSIVFVLYGYQENGATDKNKNPAYLSDGLRTLSLEAVATESFDKLQYALDSGEMHVGLDNQESHLHRMSRHTNTFTTYIEALVSKPSIDRKPFHELHQQFFPWWNLSAVRASVPWEPRVIVQTGIVLTVGGNNFLHAAHCIRKGRQIYASYSSVLCRRRRSS